MVDKNFFLWKNNAFFFAPFPNEKSYLKNKKSFENFRAIKQSSQQKKKKKKMVRSTKTRKSPESNIAGEGQIF